MQQNGKRCATCKYFHLVAEQYECRAEPPRAFFVGMTDKGPAFQSRFANTLPDWYCGMWAIGIIEATDMSKLPKMELQ